MSDHMDGESISKRQARWISQPFSDLVLKLKKQKDFCFDVVIVGSGYGGAMAAAELAGCKDSNGRPISVCVLERGEEYLAGSFPSRASDLPGHVRFSSPNTSKPGGQRDALLDYRIGNGMNTLLANGLGGGSLINAAVMEIPPDDVFDSNWPKQLQDFNELRPFYHEAKHLLGGADKGANDNTINRHIKHQQQPLQKYQSLQKIGKEHFRPAAITVGMQDTDTTSAGVTLNACRLCGDCATGCNHGAKNSLDINLLKSAYDKGAEIYTGVTVLDFKQCDEQWLLCVNYTDEKLALRQNQGEGHAITINTHKLILAAGTLGSTELMLKARQAHADNFLVSEKLGQRFSSNGDMIAVAYAQNEAVNAVADETMDYDQREIGPTITGIVDAKSRQKSEPLIIEEMAVPGALKRIFTELYTTVNSLHELERADLSQHQNGLPENDAFAVHASDIHRTAIYAIIGRDSADGELKLPAFAQQPDNDGLVCVDWPTVNRHELFDEQIRTIESLLRSSGAGGRVLPNPAWKLLPDRMSDVLGGATGSLLTVHPLGGCVMADDILHGVVNDRGQVFTRDTNSNDHVHKNLVILDGAIIPSSIGTNPALSIAAISLRAIRCLKQEWGFSSTDTHPINPCTRPVYWHAKKPVEPIATEIELQERTSAILKLHNRHGDQKDWRVELTLFFSHKHLLDVITPDDEGRLHDPTFRVNVQKSYLRIINDELYQKLLAEKSSHRELELALDEVAELKVPVSGDLKILGRTSSNALSRIITSSSSWFLNRGLRDIAQSNNKDFKRSMNRFLSLYKLASRAGEERLFEYALEIDDIDSAHPFSHISGRRIQAVKRIRYQRRSNPWKQLMMMEVIEFPGWSASGSSAALELDLRFLGRIRRPLFHIVKHDNEVNSLLDLASFIAYFLRLFIHIHLWSFRKPELQRPRVFDRLSGYVKGLPEPEIIYINVRSGKQTTISNDKDVLRLTHYPRNTVLPESQQRSAVVMFHGYSASGTTYAHPALKPGLAKFLWDKGHDIWIADFRSSCGMPGAQVAWSFEDIAHHDIPTVLAYIFERNEHLPVDVIAHCMGSAMFSMAVLGNEQNSFSRTTKSKRTYTIQQMVRQAVLSQVGPHVIFTPINVFRSYISSYLRHYLPFKAYEFRPSELLSNTTQLLDRLLYSLPYPEEEFDREHPWSSLKQPVEFVASRRRMDALYGRAFNLKGIPADVLLCIDDFFGPLSMDTVAQVIQFTRYRTVTNRNGINCYTSADNIARHWNFPTLSIHGKHNGLADILTTGRMKTLMQASSKNYHCEIAECGHQDSLIGSSAETLKLFHRISDFLQDLNAYEIEHPTDDATTSKFMLDIPWAGPLLGPRDNDIDLPSGYASEKGHGAYIHVMAGGNPLHGHPHCVAYIPVKKVDNLFHALFDESGHIDCATLTTLDNILLIQTNIEDDFNWCRHKIPVALMQDGVDGILQVMVYSQHADNLPLINFINDCHSAAPIVGQCLQHEQTEIQTCTRELIRTLARFIAENDAQDLLPGLIQFSEVQKDSVTSLQFALGSCQYPAGILYPEKGVQSYRSLSRTLDDTDSSHKPEFLILSGDQVYVDATAGLFDPSNSNDKYVPQYLRQYHQLEIRHVYRRLCTYTMLDDHEIDNDWEPIANRTYRADALQQGKRYYLNFQRHVAPVLSADTSIDKTPLWYQFTRSGFQFFMLDTRTDRSPRRADSVFMAQLISDKQFKDLEQWLYAVQGSAKPKFIVSPSLPFPRQIKSSGQGKIHHAIYADSWDGYPTTLHRLLSLIYQLKIENLVFLSGDEHISCDASMVITDKNGNNPLTVRSIHSSPLNAPFPFANASAGKFIHNETFEIVADNTSYQAEVTSDWYSGDGFAFLTVRKEKSWEVDVNFDGAIKMDLTQ